MEMDAGWWRDRRERRLAVVPPSPLWSVSHSHSLSHNSAVYVCYIFSFYIAYDFATPRVCTKCGP